MLKACIKYDIMYILIFIVFAIDSAMSIQVPSSFFFNLQMCENNEIIIIIMDHKSRNLRLDNNFLVFLDTSLLELKT